MAEPIIRKDGTNYPVYKMPSTYESERVTYGDSNVKDELDAINSNLSKNNFGTDVDLSSYTTSGSAYEFPSDGIVLISNQASTSGVLTFFVLGNLSSNGPLMSVEGSANIKYASLTVKKGMKGFILTNTLNNTKTCMFRPYV